MILVTGGTGLVGSHLLLELVKAGYDVRAIKRASADIELVKQLFTYYSDNGEELFRKIEWQESDILDVVTLDEVFENVTHVYHCAANVSFQKKQSQNLYKVNVDGTANIVNMCLKHKVEKLCYVSSTSALGKENNGTLISEETSWQPGKKVTNYSISKYQAEQEVWRGVQEGLNCVIVNPGIIIGPGDWNKTSLTIFKTVWKGLKYYTDGENGFVDVRDVAKSMTLLMNSTVQNEKFLLIGENMKFKRLFDLIADKFHKEQPGKYVSRNMSDIAWRIEGFLSFLNGKEPRITKETTRSAYKKMIYSNQKIKDRIDFEFIPITEAVDNACLFFDRLSSN